MEENKIFVHTDWVIDWNGLDTIFEFGDLWLIVEDLPDLPKHALPEINQYVYDKTKSACTIVNAYKEACYLYEMEATQSEMLECVVFAHDIMNYTYGKWWFADMGMKAVEKFREKKYPDKPLYYSTIRRDDVEFPTLLKKWYMIGFTYKGNSKYNADYQPDCILNWDSFWVSTYWHRTSFIFRDWKLIVCDSSSGHKYNEYEIPTFTKLIANHVYDWAFYVFTKEMKYDKNELARLTSMRTILLSRVDEAIKLIDKSNNQARKDQMTISKNNDKAWIAEINELIKKQTPTS